MHLFVSGNFPVQRLQERPGGQGQDRWLQAFQILQVSFQHFEVFAFVVIIVCFFVDHVKMLLYVQQYHLPVFMPVGKHFSKENSVDFTFL